ncbi:MAG: tRNA (guanine-N(7)-)-methyltransferase [Legionellaceae bacterium]
MEPISETTFLRRNRSFVRREGRMTISQQKALEQYWPHYGLSVSDKPIILNNVFGREAKHCVEIGFGMGNTLLDMAKQQQDWNFIGIEVHRPGVGALLGGIEQYQLKNIRIFCDDALDVLKYSILDNSLDKVQLFFPDPWPKKRHQKRRIIQPEFVNLIHQKLAINGVFHMATDWENYAFQMLEVMRNHLHFINLSPTNDFIPRPEERPYTKFELRGERLGHGVWDLMFKKV